VRALRIQTVLTDKHACRLIPLLKGKRHEMSFFNVLKITALFVRALVIFNFVCLFVKKIQNKVLLSSMKALLIVKILPVDLFGKPPMTLKVFLKAACDPAF
jgi:hypothetical protein